MQIMIINSRAHQKVLSLVVYNLSNVIGEWAGLLPLKYSITYQSLLSDYTLKIYVHVKTKLFTNTQKPNIIEKKVIMNMFTLMVMWGFLNI